MCALRANRNTGAQTNVGPSNAGAVNTNAGANTAPQANQGKAAPVQTSSVPAVVNNGGAVAPKSNNAAALQDLNAGILDNIDNLGNAGNYVTMDGTQFLFKATETSVDSVDVVVTYGKRYYQWVEEDGESKIFHNNDTKLDDRYKLRFEIHWVEEDEEGAEVEYQFHMPTASAMRFIDYVKALAQAGFGIGQVVTRMTISRQQQKGTTNRYSRAEFTMIGIMDADGNYNEVANGVTTVGKK